MALIVLAIVLGVGILAFRIIRKLAAVIKSQDLNAHVSALLHDYVDLNNDKIELAVQLLSRLAYGQVQMLNETVGVSIQNVTDLNNSSVYLALLFLAHLDTRNIVDFDRRIISHFANMVSRSEPQKLASAYSFADLAFRECETEYSDLVALCLSDDQFAKASVVEHLMNKHAGRSDQPEHAHRQFELFLDALIVNARSAYALIAPE